MRLDNGEVAIMFTALDRKDVPVRVPMGSKPRTPQTVATARAPYVKRVTR